MPKSTDKDPADPSNYRGITLVSVKYLRKSSFVASRQLVSLTNYIHSKENSKRPKYVALWMFRRIPLLDCKFNVLNLPNIATLNQIPRAGASKRHLESEPTCTY